MRSSGASDLINLATRKETELTGGCRQQRSAEGKECGADAGDASFPAARNTLIRQTPRSEGNSGVKDYVALLSGTREKEI